jgi:hypothetical protein
MNFFPAGTQRIHLISELSVRQPKLRIARGAGGYVSSRNHPA